MREIKFRAWYSDKWVYFTIGDQLSDVKEAIYSNVCINGGKFFQYTGLKDKNGVEIYEGDVFEYKEDKNLRSVVVFENGRFCYNPDSFFNVELFNPSFTWLDGVAKEIEVIGNIHENPELL